VFYFDRRLCGLTIAGNQEDIARDLPTGTQEVGVGSAMKARWRDVKAAIRAKGSGYIVTSSGTHIQLSPGKKKTWPPVKPTPRRPRPVAPKPKFKATVIVRKLDVYECWWSGSPRAFYIRAQSVEEAARRFAGKGKVQRRSRERFQKGAGKESPVGLGVFYIRLQRRER
jgi:hypothetical protein